MIQRIETERNVTFELGKRAAAAVGVVDPAIAMAMTKAAGRLGIRSMPWGVQPRMMPLHSPQREFRPQCSSSATSMAATIRKSTWRSMISSMPARSDPLGRRKRELSTSLQCGRAG